MRATPSWLLGVVACMAVAVALIVVKCGSIATGPSWRAAATAVLIAEAELSRAEDTPQEIGVREADALLGEAVSHLGEGRYEDSIAAAVDVKRTLRD